MKETLYFDGIAYDFSETTQAGELAGSLAAALTEPTNDTFHIGQPYENELAKKIACSICKGDKFNVASGSYFTAIKCVKCGWEICYHSG